MQILEGKVENFIGTIGAVEAKYAPEKLYVCGDKAIMRKRPRISVIGSRDASPQALSDANQIACNIVKNGGVVVSGLAKGVDAAAHLGALSCGGDTMAVLGTPLSQFYPRENKQLQERLYREGVVVTQFAEGRPSGRNNFPMRNRTMALLSHASVIVAAAAKSGTEHQGWEALRLGRFLFLPQALTEAAFDWPRKMLNYGAITYQDPIELDEILAEVLPSAVPISTTSAQSHHLAF